MEHMDLLALADFNLVARHGSFGEAARATGRPKATLSRRVSELETSLKLRLFERGPRGLKLTQEGHALYERTGALLTEIAESAAAIASGSDRPRGRLRISAPMLFSQIAMGKLVATFALKYPEVQLEVTTEDRGVDMIEEGYDLVIRVNPDPDESLIGRVFLRDRLVVVATHPSPQRQPPDHHQSLPRLRHPPPRPLRNLPKTPPRRGRKSITRLLCLWRAVIPCLPVFWSFASGQRHPQIVQRLGVVGTQFQRPPELGHHVG